MNSKNKTHYLGKDIQNEIISLISGVIKTRILNMVKEAKYCSIIFYCTPDLSHVEQMTIIIRFVFVESSRKDSNVTICEHFLCFIPVESITGMGLSDIIIHHLKDLGIPIENMRGHRYDNGANMKGKHSGVQRRICNTNPRAFNVPCRAHSLNLVVNNANLMVKPKTRWVSKIESLKRFHYQIGEIYYAFLKLCQIKMWIL